MTPEELENLVKRGDGMAIANALQSLSESERRKLSKTASTLLREIERFQRVSWDTTDDSRFKVSAVMRRILGARFHRVALHKKKYAAELAVMGLCPISVTKRVHASHYHHRDKTPDDFIKVLSDRCPPWIDNWIAERLKGEWPTIDWHVFLIF